MQDIIYELITKRRSIRRFKPQKVPYSILEKAVNAGRIAPSARNLQPLEYIIVDEDNLLPKVFSAIKLAGYLEWNPEPAEMPRAYIVVLARKDDAFTKYDVGLAAENIILSCLENGVGSCLIKSFAEDKIKKIFDIPQDNIVEVLIALGYPAEEPVLEEMKTKDGSIKYWKDEAGVLHVPKKAFKNIVYKNKFGRKIES